MKEINLPDIQAFAIDELTEDGEQVYSIHSTNPGNTSVLKGVYRGGKFVLVSRQCWNCFRPIGLCFCGSEPDWFHYS